MQSIEIYNKNLIVGKLEVHFKDEVYASDPIKTMCLQKLHASLSSIILANDANSFDKIINHRNRMCSPVKPFE